ncbi:MAG: condensation domain-containing protein, partial [Exilibacterium sp.]
PLVQLTLAPSRARGERLVLMTLHHIIIDHVGLEYVLQELGAYLAQQTQHWGKPLPYREFVAHSLARNNDRNVLEFFKKYLGDFTRPSSPYELVDVRGDGSHIEQAHKVLPSALAQAIRSTSRRLQTSPATLFHAAWAMVMAVTSNCDDVVFGTVLSGRLQGTMGAERSLGLFINTLPLRLRLKDKNVEQLLVQTEQALRDLLHYEHTPLVQVQECSGLASGKPLFSAVLNYRHSHEFSTDEDQVRMRQAQFGIATLSVKERSNYPLNVSISDYGEKFSLEALIDRSVSADKVLGYFESALVELLNALNQKSRRLVLQFSIVSPAEQNMLLQQWSQTARWSATANLAHKKLGIKGVYVLNQYHRVVPVGVVGELYLACQSTEGNSSTRVIANPFDVGGVAPYLFRSGDWVRWLPSGELDYIGRSEQQRQWECAHLEALLARHPSISEVAVVPVHSVISVSAAYLVPKDNFEWIMGSAERNKDNAERMKHNVESCIDRSTLLRYITSQPGFYTIPHSIECLRALPKNPDGTPDFARLQTMANKAVRIRERIDPETETEKILIEFWGQLLPYAADEISCDDNFFALGGQSLLITQLATRVNDQFLLELTLRDLYEKENLRAMAALIDREQKLNALDEHFLDSMSEEEAEKFLYDLGDV